MVNPPNPDRSGSLLAYQADITSERTYEKVQRFSIRHGNLGKGLEGRRILAGSRLDLGYIDTTFAIEQTREISHPILVQRSHHGSYRSARLKAG
jgi:hypothetical protein